MTVITAYKSEADGEIFEHKGEYQRHLQKLSATRRRVKKQVDRENLRLSVVERMRAECESFDELEAFLLAHWKEMVTDGSKLTRIKFSEMRWRDSVSNTHECPKGGVTNWWSKEDLPTGYPGWQGRIIFHITDDVFGSRAIQSLGIYSGSGGESYGYEVRLFSDDFPGLTKAVVWAKLAK